MRSEQLSRQVQFHDSVFETSLHCDQHGKFVVFDPAQRSRHTCPKKAGPGCLEDQIRRSYFHIAAENSVCPDYVTEKYWDRWRLPAIPVVLNRSVLHDYAPPGHRAQTFLEFPEGFRKGQVLLTPEM